MKPEWMLKHSIKTSYISGGIRLHGCVVGIHPECDLIFFTAGRATKLMCYNMNSREVKVISKLEYGDLPYLPYVPLYAELQSLHTWYQWDWWCLHEKWISSRFFILWSSGLGMSAWVRFSFSFTDVRILLSLESWCFSFVVTCLISLRLVHVVFKGKMIKKKCYDHVVKDMICDYHGAYNLQFW